ncbi:MAG: Ig-like domain-containing protein [Cyclobacteriaceae bacterium]
MKLVLNNFHKLGFTILILFSSCIQTDLQDAFPETIRIVNGKDLVFRVGGTYNLKGEYTDISGEPVPTSIVWSSSDESILSFEDSVAFAHAEGSVKITAEANGLQDEMTVEVLGSRELLNISKSVSVLQIDRTFTFDIVYNDISGTPVDINPVWTSSDTQVASISQSGLVTAISQGTTNISASYMDLSDTVQLTVTISGEEVDPEIKITEFAMFLTVGSNFTFAAQYTGSDGSPVDSPDFIWTSSNTNVATVSNEGIVTAISVGTTNIGVSFEGINTSIMLTVDDASNVTPRTGTLMGTGYSISGDFTLGINATGDLILTIEGYVPAGPGPYFYLTNSDANVANALNLGDAKIAGDITINVSEADSEATINSFNYLMIWCEPFGVRLGVGQFEN